MAKRSGKKGFKGFIKGFGIFLLVCAGLYLLIFLANIVDNQLLRKYINSFDPVEYGSDRLVPQLDPDTGYYSFTSDDDINIMQITDIHLGGGFWSFKKDKKTIYEVITMLQEEKPDFVITTGDNTFCVPGPLFNGGGTFNNKAAAETVISIFEHEKVYFSTTFGNHDTESFDYFNRSQVGSLYMDDRFSYCFFDQDFTDPDATTKPSVTNQCILLKNTNGKIKKVILLIDSNAYMDESLSATINWDYDIVHNEQVDWAAGVIKDLSAKEGLPSGKYLKSIMFMHIPIPEYRLAYDELIEESTDADGNPVFTPKKSTIARKISGVWDETEAICYGGWRFESSLAEKDNLFEVMCEQLGSTEAIFCGHDHVNNAVVMYKGVYLVYGNSIDNLAYSHINEYGLQRGANDINIAPDGSLTFENKNAYTNYHCDLNKFYNVQLNDYYNLGYDR